jgi:hypothetical protein
LCEVSDLSSFMLVDTNTNIRACQTRNEQERRVKPEMAGCSVPWKPITGILKT